MHLIICISPDLHILPEKSTFATFMTMKMSTEAESITGVMIIVSIILLLINSAVSGCMYLLSDIPFRKSFTWGLLSLTLPPVFIAYGSLIERNIYDINRIEIRHEEIPDGFDGYRIVHISDIHARSYANRQRSLDKAAGIINALSADLIAFTGDLITLLPEETDLVAGPLGSLKATDGIISVLGNHDYGIYSGQDTDSLTKIMIRKEKKLGWDVLMDENRIISRGDDSIAVVGVQYISSSSHFPSKGNLSKASEGTDGMFRILLSHDPFHWEKDVAGRDYPLTLSGHTHAMQFSIFGWSPSSLKFRQYRGLYTRGNEHIYVNTGLGETIFPARIGVRPEITLITLRKEVSSSF